MFYFTKLNDSVIEKILYHLLEKSCEIDAMSYRYESIINLLKSLKEEDELLLHRIEKILKKYINDHMSVRHNIILSDLLSNNIKKIRKYDIDNLYGSILSISDTGVETHIDSREALLCFFNYISHLLYVKLIPGSYAKDLYKISNAELEQLEGYDSMYSEEIIKRYICKKYGQEKIDKKRIMIDKKSEYMKLLRKEESERKERLMQERKCIVYDILAQFGLHYMYALYEADRFITEGGILNEEELLKEAKRIIEKNREEQKRKDIIKDKLTEYNCMEHKLHYLCKDYVKNGSINYSIDYVIEYIRDLVWIEKNTNYYSLVNNRNPLYNWDEILGRYISIREYKKIFNDYNDLNKTYAVELWLEKNDMNIDKSNIPPPVVIKRMEEVIEKREFNLEKERLINEERKNKIETNKNKKKIKYS